MVECLTDNPNRTFRRRTPVLHQDPKVKSATQGSVSHMFDHSAILVFDNDDEEAVLEALMMADVDVSDIECEAGKVTVFTPHTEYFKAKQAIVDAFGGVDFEIDEIQFIPQSPAPLGEDDQAALDAFMDMLEDLEDVQSVYHSVA